MAGVAAVEAEGVLVQVVAQVVVADGALMRAHQSALEQAGDAVNLGHRDVSGIARGPDVRDDVAEAVLTDAVVPDPVGPDLAGAVHVIEHEVGQDVLARVRDLLHPYPTRAALQQPHLNTSAAPFPSSSAAPRPLAVPAY